MVQNSDMTVVDDTLRYFGQVQINPYWFSLPILILQISSDKITSGFLNLLLLTQKAVNQIRVIN